MEKGGLDSILERLQVDDPSVIRHSVQKLESMYSQTSRNDYLSVLKKLVTDARFSSVASFEAISSMINLVFTGKLKDQDVVQFFVSVAANVPGNVQTHFVESFIKILPEVSTTTCPLVLLSEHRKDVVYTFLEVFPDFIRSDFGFFKIFSPLFGKIFAGSDLNLLNPLVQSLCHLAMVANTEDILKYLFFFIPTFNIDHSDLYLSLLWPLQSCLDVLIMQKESLLVDSMFHHLFSLLGELKKRSKEFSPILANIVMMFDTWPEKLTKYHMVLGVCLLRATTSKEFSIFLSLVTNSVFYSNDKKIGMFDPDILQIVLLHSMSSCATVSQKNMVTNALKRLETIESVEFDHFKALDSFSLRFVRGDLAMILNHADNLSRKGSMLTNSRIQEDIEYVTCLVGSKFLKTRGKIERVEFLKTIEHLSKKYPLKFGLSILSLIFSELNHETNPQTKIAMMYALPSIGTNHFLCVGAVNKILNAFLKTPSLKPIAIQLFTNLWLENDRFFSKVATVLTDVVGENYMDLDVELRLSVTLALRNITRKSPAKGLELISLLSKVLTLETHPTILCLGIQAIGYLCKSDLLDFYTAWFRIIGTHVEKISKSSEAVTVEMLHFYSFGVEGGEMKRPKPEDILNEYEAENEDLREIVLSLIEYCKVDHSDSIRVAAFLSLGKFPLNAIIYSLTPEIEEVEVEEGEESTEETAVKDIFTISQEQKKMVASIVDAVLRNLTHASVEVQNASVSLLSQIYQSELVKPVGGMKDKELSSFSQIQRFILEEYRKGSADLIAPAVAWCMDLQSTSVFKKNLKDLVRDASVDSSLFGHLFLARGFTEFISKSFDVIQGEFKENSAQNTFDFIFNELKMLTESTTVPAVLENIINCFSALSSALPTQAQQNNVYIFKYLESLLKSLNLNEWIVLAITMGMARSCGSQNPKDLQSSIEFLVDQFANDASFIHTGISLGLIASTIMSSETNELTNPKEIKTLEKIAGSLFSFAYPQVENPFKSDSQRVIYECGPSALLGLAILAPLLAKYRNDEFTVIFQLLHKSVSKPDKVDIEDISFHAMKYFAYPHFFCEISGEENVQTVLKCYEDTLKWAEKTGKSNFEPISQLAKAGLGSLCYNLLRLGYTLKFEDLTRYIEAFGVYTDISSIYFTLFVHGSSLIQKRGNLFEILGDKRILTNFMESIAQMRSIYMDKDPKCRRIAAMSLGMLYSLYQNSLGDTTSLEKNKVHLNQLENTYILESLSLLEVENHDYMLRAILLADYLPNVVWSNILKQSIKGNVAAIKILVADCLVSSGGSSSLKTIVSLISTKKAFNSLSKEVQIALITDIPRLLKLLTPYQLESMLSSIEEPNVELTLTVLASTPMESMTKELKTTIQAYLLGIFERIPTISNYDSDIKQVKILASNAKYFDNLDEFKSKSIENSAVLMALSVPPDFVSVRSFSFTSSAERKLVKFVSQQVSRYIESNEKLIQDSIELLTVLITERMDVSRTWNAIEFVSTLIMEYRNSEYANFGYGVHNTTQPTLPDIFDCLNSIALFFTAHFDKNSQISALMKLLNLLYNVKCPLNTRELFLTPLILSIQSNSSIKETRNRWILLLEGEARSFLSSSK